MTDPHLPALPSIFLAGMIVGILVDRLLLLPAALLIVKAERWWHGRRR